MKMRDIMRIVEGEADAYQGAPLHSLSRNGPLPFDTVEVLRYLIRKIQASSGPIADIKAFAEERLHTAYTIVAGHFNRGSIPIYRMITAPEDWEAHASLTRRLTQSRLSE